MSNLKRKIKGIILKNIMWNANLLPKRKEVVFTSFEGKQYSCNPRAISEKLYSIDPSIQIVWIFKNEDVDCPDYIKKVRKGSIESIIEYGRSLAWVDNCNKPEYYYKSANQMYIQTWHGDCSFKRLVGDNPNDKLNVCLFDYGVTGSEMGENYIFRKAFHYNGNLLKYGSPRNDCLIFRDSVRYENIKKILNIEADIKVVIFAPTFRDSRVGISENIELPFNVNSLIKKLEKATGMRWVLLYRGHHVTTDMVHFGADSDKVIDVTDYEDMADLMVITDLLITDYSSCACDFILSGKPSILYHWDNNDYSLNDRSTLFKDEELPFIVSYTPEELYSNAVLVSTRNNDEYCSQIKEFYGSYESGHAAEKIARKIKEHVDQYVKENLG